MILLPRGNPVREKVNPGKIVTRAKENKRPILVTSRGRGVAVVQGLEDYEMLEEKVAFMQAVTQGLMEVNEGKVTVSLAFENFASTGRTVSPGIFYINDVVVRDNDGVSEVIIAAGVSTHRDDSNHLFGVDDYGIWKSNDNNSSKFTSAFLYFSLFLNKSKFFLMSFKLCILIFYHLNSNYGNFI